MADDKTTKMPEQPVTDTGPGKETPPEPEKTSIPPEAEKNGYTSALKAPVRCFGNQLSGKGKSSFRTDNEYGGAASLKDRIEPTGQGRQLVANDYSLSAGSNPYTSLIER